MADEKVVVTRRMPPAGVKFLQDEKFSLMVWDKDEPPPRKWLLEKSRGAQAIFCSLNEKIDKTLLNNSPNLKVIAQLAVGYDNIDVEEAMKRGIIVAYTPDVLSGAVADLTWGLIISVARRIPEADQYVRKGKWKVGFMPVMLTGRNVYGKTLGVLGMGRIGREVAKRSQGFGMRVIYHNRKPADDPPAGARYVDFKTLLSESDFLVILVRLSADTEGMIGFEEFSRMKKTAYVINASRGKVIRQKDLYRALSEGVIAGAGLDVLEDEPVRTDEPLLKLPNIVFTPHIGSDTFETRREMSLLCAKAIHSVLRLGRIPENSLPKRQKA